MQSQRDNSTERPAPDKKRGKQRRPTTRSERNHQKRKEEEQQAIAPQKMLERIAEMYTICRINVQDCHPGAING